MTKIQNKYNASLIWKLEFWICLGFGDWDLEF
jgi:hypothetical protein